EGNGHGSQELSLIGYSPLEKYKQITQASSGLSWYTFAWQSSEELFAPTQKLFLWISTAGFVSVLLIAFMGWIAAKSIVKPIRLLQKTAASIGRGEDVPHLEIRTGDEIQLLADEINTMNSLLKKTFSGLENKVEEKTREVTYLKEYTERVLMSVPEAIVIFNNKEKIEFVNTAFEKFTGIQQKDCLGKSVREALPQFYKELDSLSKELTAYQRGGASGLANVTSNQGSTYQAQDPLRPKEKENQSEVQSTLSIGDWLLAYQFFDMVIAGDEARRTGLLMKDITDERKLLDHLVLAEKLSGLGTLAAGIAHEMNNPLFSIMGYTEAILDEKDPKEMHKYAEKVLDRSKHMASVILNFAGYSRSNARDGVAPVQLNEKLDAALDMAVLASYSDDIKVTRNYEEIPPIKAKPEEIQQIFLNLIGNAVQAMDGKGELDLTTRRYAGLMEIQIKDSGPGISPEHILKIFDPFFTTKEQGKGTGLGLNIVHRVIEKYGGNIRVESERGKGACFIITFPAKD
ncbi:MAG: PAS domain-containing sensor histidine kinase, partial [Nitrospinaceae bacterium]